MQRNAMEIYINMTVMTDSESLKRSMERASRKQLMCNLC